MSSVNFSKENPQDPFVKRKLTLSDHGTTMGLIEKDIAPQFQLLAVQFCIPQGTINTIAYNNRNNSAWHGLNDVVADWLRGNTTVYDKGVKANVRWLYDAVRTVNKTLGTKIAKEFEIPEPSDWSTQEAVKGGLDHLASSTGIEQTDLGCSYRETLGSTGAGPESSKSDDQKPPDVSEFFPKLEDFESEEKMMKKYSTQLTKEEQEFIEEVNVILVTATTTEYRAVMGATESTGGDGKYIKVITKDGSTNFILGKYGPCNVAVIMTGQGPIETKSVLSSVQNDVKAKYVIAIGICYGAKESKTDELSDKTKLADIIVAKSILDTTEKRYEGTKMIIKTKEYQCGRELCNLLSQDRLFKVKSKSVKVHVGALASEFTLQCNEEEKQKILEQAPRALGGEMEAIGIHLVTDAVVEKDKFQWIVIKSIVDWGNEGKDKNWQPFGAVSSARFVLKCLKDWPGEGDPLKKQ